MCWTSLQIGRGSPIPSISLRAESSWESALLIWYVYKKRFKIMKSNVQVSILMCMICFWEEEFIWFAKFSSISSAYRCIDALISTECLIQIVFLLMIFHSIVVSLIFRCYLSSLKGFWGCWSLLDSQETGSVLNTWNCVFCYLKCKPLPACFCWQGFGLSRLREGASSQNLRSIICVLTLLFYNTYVSLILGRKTLWLECYGLCKHSFKQVIQMNY